MRLLGKTALNSVGIIVRVVVVVLVVVVVGLVVVAKFFFSEEFYIKYLGQYVSLF